MSIKITNTVFEISDKNNKPIPCSSEVTPVFGDIVYSYIHFNNGRKIVKPKL